MPRQSLVRRLQLGFAVGSLGTIALLAVVLDGALERALDHEDAVVMRGQAASLLAAVGRGSLPTEVSGGRAEKAEWRIVDQQGVVLAQSWGMAQLHVAAWPAAMGEVNEIIDGNGQLLSVLQQDDGAGHAAQLAMDRSHEQSLLRNYRVLLWLSALAAGALATLTGRVIAVRGLRPLAAIGQATALVGPGALSVRLDATGYPVELRQLVDSLNTSFGRLDAAFQRMTAFGSDLAHELRTPLQNLRAVVEGLVLGRADAAAVTDRLGDIVEELDRLTAMVEQMLFLARAEDPRMAVAAQWQPAHAALAATAAFFSASADDAGVTLQVDCAADSAVWADPALLQRALHNLVANALRHSPAGGVVRLSARREVTATVLGVSDDGPGLQVELQERIGERFLRGDPSRARTSGGTGLGLAIVLTIAKLHGGTLQWDGAALLRLPDPVTP